MRFLDLYKNNRKTVVDALKSMWCGETVNESQRAYAKQIEELIPELFAPSNAIPLVQCMNLYEPVADKDAERTKELVGGLWDKPSPKPYNPYEHQRKCWEAMLDTTGLPKSICVTTGTGSGKTECFMIPLVYDLLRMQKENPGADRNVQALFLYPLNALMEDQKERLEELLEGTNLTYAVYNGDLPERVPGENDHSDNAEKIRKQIRQIRGWDEDTRTYRFKHIMYTREEVRRRRPNILLTNPTMLEYILLRRRDEQLIDPTAKSLKWVAIDETHTYTGAGAAELAMLLRRVLLAFGVEAKNVHFATSSATFGNGGNEAQENKALKDFISGITGTHIDQIEVIKGDRIGKNKIPNNEDKSRWERIFNEDFVTLASLFPDRSTIEDQLQALDEMVDRMGDCTDMKVKVHYFYRVPNNGLYVRLDQINEDGTFELYSENKLGKESDTPLVELTRCKNCGEYVAIVRRNKDDGTFFGIEPDDSDIFDLEDTDNNPEIETKIFALSNKPIKKGQGNSIYRLVEGNKLIPALPGEVDPKDWHLVANQHSKCPYCNCRLTKQKDSNGDLDAQTTEEINEEGTLKKFRLSPEFISRVLAPSVLDQLDKFTSPDGEELLHDGQQYISFADSRQLAAKATLKQNQEQERMWFYSTIYHELCKKSLTNNSAEINDLTTRMSKALLEGRTDEAIALGTEIKALSSKELSWAQIYNILYNNKYCDRFCYEFVKRSNNSDETDNEGAVYGDVKEKYVLSIMTMYLASRPRSSAAPETMGLFCPCYNKLNNIKVPDEVNTEFNQIINNEENKITDEDWKNLLQVFIDYRVRSDQSVYLQQQNSNIDIFGTVRFAVEKSHRKPAQKPSLDKKTYSTSRIVRYLCALLCKDNSQIEDEADAYRMYFDTIQVVIEALWDDLVNNTKLLQVGTHFDKDKGRFVNDADGGLRLNLADMSFKLYENVYLADTNSEYDEVTNHAECLRPIETHFKEFSPYLRGGKAVELNKDYHAEWKPYPYFIGSGQAKSIEEIIAWSKQERKNLWIKGHELWGESGVFADRLNDIHHGPNLFLQAEHTAQVDKMISRQLQLDFKNHKINILACSTTMEMGVDLGTLQLVMLSSVPPQPSNYKQRAGRSGRNVKMVRSACITLCSSDAIGMRTLSNPLDSIINRPVEMPHVDLKSPQVIQRHANSFLIRSLGVFGNGSVNQKVIDFYTDFHIECITRGEWVVRDKNNRTQDPITKLGNPAGTMYAQFCEECIPAKISPEIRNNMQLLLKDTVFDGKVNEVIDKARIENERCYKELNDRLEDIKIAYVNCTGQSEREVRFRRKLNFEYMTLLEKRLLSFWATHRFTPNANMPVDVLELDLDPMGKRSYGINTSSSNPSYSLREAIAQYAPGNRVVVDGVVYAVRGIEFQNKYQGPSAFKRIARNNDETVMGDKVDTLSGKKEWWDNTGRYVIELVEPVGFIPDINEESTRIVDKNAFTRVNAQLIDAAEWVDNQVNDNNHLYMIRCNRDSGNAKILYYNEGIGFGYCLCTRCGRMVLETEVPHSDPDNPSSLSDLPRDFNLVPQKKLDPATGLRVVDYAAPRYHLAISGKEAKMKCGGSNDKNSVRRNVIIGGLLQTDFSEIKIRHNGHQWMHDRTTERDLLFTLGIVFTQALVEVLGKERNAVDFAILPFGHLCIFDTNPGGAGYSNQLVKPGMMDKVLAKAEKILNIAKEKNSKEYLLDKFTLRFIRYVNIQAALDWIEEEHSMQKNLPDEVEKAFPSKIHNTLQTSLYSMKKSFEGSNDDLTLFVSDDYKSWDYTGGDQSWRDLFYNSFNMHATRTRFCVIKHSETKMPEPILDMIRSLNGWANNSVQIKSPFAGKNIYPLAFIDGRLYFTTKKVNTNLNGDWAGSEIFSCEVDNPCNRASIIDCSYNTETTQLFFLNDDSCKVITSKKLGEVIHKHNKTAQGIIDKFIDHCKSTDGALYVSYQDEHMKSLASFVLTLQTIEYFTNLIDKDFRLEFLLEEYYYDIQKRGIFANIQDSDKRDDKLVDTINHWMIDLDYSVDVEPIDSKPAGYLTHWRVLTFEYNGKRLSIYPDGGLLNGWKLGRLLPNERYDYYDTTTDDDLPLQRQSDIKFEVHIEDI